MRREEHRAAIDRLAALVENCDQAAERALRAKERHQRRLEAHRAELEQHEQEEWVNARIAELDAADVGAADIAHALRQERGYVITYMAVYLRILKLRRAAEALHLIL